MCQLMLIYLFRSEKELLLNLKKTKLNINELISLLWMLIKYVFLNLYMQKGNDVIVICKDFKCKWIVNSNSIYLVGMDKMDHAWMYT